MDQMNKGENSMRKIMKKKIQKALSFQSQGGGIPNGGVKYVKKRRKKLPVG